MFELKVEPSGETISIQEDQTILDSLLRAGLNVPYQCGHGLCSTCKVMVLDGEIDHGEASPFALLDFERDEGVTLACSATPRSDLVIEVEVENDEDARLIPVQDFEGIVERMEMVSPDIKAVWLRLSQPLDFQAGQYINLSLPNIKVPRAFSIASPVSTPDLIELHVRLVENGEATTYIHNKLALGDRLDMTGPLGRFFVRKSRQSPCLFIAGGSGLSSPKSMVLDLFEEGFAQPIYLLHGTRTVRDIYYYDLFTNLQAQHDNFTYIPVPFKVEDEDKWEGAQGALHDVLDAQFNSNFSDYTAYLCGPPGMVEQCIKKLMRGRLFEKDIFTESFLTLAEADSVTRSKIFTRL